MPARYLYLWFRHITTDWLVRRRPLLKDVPFVLSQSERNRKVITMASVNALKRGIEVGMVVADARMLVPELEVMDDIPGQAEKLLQKLALWTVQYTPAASVDHGDGLILEISGCAHLWGGERLYFKTILERLRGLGYVVRGAIADTIGASWAWARFGSGSPILSGFNALESLSPAALRLEPETLLRLKKVGIRNIRQILEQPGYSLPPRFGGVLVMRLKQAFGQELEVFNPLVPVEPYQERLPCMEPIVTIGGIEIALQRLLEALCLRLKSEGKGLRSAVFSAFRIDGQIQPLMIGTTRATHHAGHLFKLFIEKLGGLEPDLGFEVFVLEAGKTEDVVPQQERLWEGATTIDSISLAELLDRITNKTGAGIIHRYLPAEHHWPERAIKLSDSLDERPAGDSSGHAAGGGWPGAFPRPIHILAKPEPIEVTAPIPDYPPMNFRYNGKLHVIAKADGPERIEDEWWIQECRHRDYYIVEDQEGARYWVFRSGHYASAQPARWYIHGFFS